MFQTHLLPTKIVTGEGSIENIKDVAISIDAKKILIYIDPVLKEIGVLNRVKSILSDLDSEIDFYSDLKPEPLVEDGDKAVEKAREFNADLVIGIGGGSCLDCAKTAAVIAKHEGSVADYLDLSGKKELDNSGIYKILIPSTTGTGAEVTPNAVFSLGNTKDVISNKFLFADTAIIDPEITYTMPSSVTASSGMDALIHAIESYTSLGASELTDVLALEAIKKIYKNIRRAVWNGKDKEARSEMSWGCLISSLSYPNSLCHGVHSLSYPLGGLFKIPHGASNAVLLPYVFDFIWPSCLDRMKEIAIAIDLPIEGLSDREISIKLVQEFYNLNKDIGLSTTIKDYGIKESDIENLAKDAIKQTRLLNRSPRKFNEEDIKNVYYAAFHEKLNTL